MDFTSFLVTHVLRERRVVLIDHSVMEGLGMRLLPLVTLMAVTTCTNWAIAQIGQEDQNDRDVHLAIEAALRADEVVPAHLIDVEVDDGIATLVGDVRTLLSDRRAIVVAESIRGVRAVVDRIAVVTPVRSDEELRQDVKAVLRQDEAVELGQVNAAVRKGHVTLSGRVDSFAERELAEEAITGLRGVIRLSNEVEVDPKSSRPSSEIEKDIEGRLSSDPWLAGYTFAVDVNGSDVALSGMVGSIAEKNIARRLAWVSGVRRVDMTDVLVERWLSKPMRRERRIAVRSDRQIEKAVNDAYLYDPRLNSSKISTRVKNGEVALFGKVSSLAASRAAERDAYNTLGVNRVLNYLKVGKVAWPGDAVVQRSVQEALQRDAHVGMLDIVATSRSGKVHLSGKVDTQFEKERAELVAANVSGVLDIDNRLIVDYTWAAKTDYEIKQDVERQFFWSPFVDGEFIHVAVDDGIVTLTGSVGSNQESGAATDNARQGGARRVVNRVRVLNEETARR